MKIISSFALAFLVAAASAPALAQDQKAAAPMPDMAASMPQDCGKASMKRHDHGAERGTGVTAGPVAMNMPCSDAAASAPAKTAKKKLTHDHAKFHKNM